MLTYNFPSNFAQAYGAGDFNGCTYNNACTISSTSTAPSTSSGLANTGVMVGLFVGVACLIVFLAMVVRFWRRPKNTSSEPNDNA